MGVVLSAVALVWASGQPVETAPPPSGPDQSAQSQEPSEGQTITVTARTRNDPIQGANAVSFDVTQAVDNKLVGPAAETYKKLVPKPARAGLRLSFGRDNTWTDVGRAVDILRTTLGSVNAKRAGDTGL